MRAVVLALWVRLLAGALPHVFTQAACDAFWNQFRRRMNGAA